jgi:HSP20 family protein
MIVRGFFNTPAWAPSGAFDELERVRRELTRVFNDFSRAREWEIPTGVFPLTNISEDKDNFYLRAELPGIKAADIEISATSNSLLISGERKIPEENAKVKYHRREREAGTFRRIVKLASQIDTSKVEARTADGVLTVILPKAEAAKPKQITIKAS